MTLRASPSHAFPCVSRSRSLAGVRPGLAGRSAAPPACIEGSGPFPPPSPRALPCWRMRDTDLSAYWTAACSMSTCASRCRFRASGVEGAGMAHSSVAALARSRGRVRVVDVEVGVNAVAGLSAQLARAFAARGGFPRHGGAKQLHSAVFFRQLGLELTCLGQLRVDIGPVGGEGGGALGPAAKREIVPRVGGTSPSPAPAARWRLLGRW
jgi:hypothetical protein